MSRIIALAGRMGSGKDTVAALLGMLGYERLAFADPLRAEVKFNLECREASNHADLDWFDALPWRMRFDLALGRLRASDVYAKPTPAPMRRVLQWHGTEYRRAQDPLYLVKLLAGKIDKRKRYVITDCRFDNEISALKDMGALIVLVDRGKARESGHVSEALEFTVPFDHVIQNTGSIHDLVERVKAIVPTGRKAAA